MKFKRDFAAITLIEMLIVLAITACILTMSISGWRSFLLRHQAESAINTLYASLNYAKQEAMLQNTPVSVCPTENGVSCNKDWSEGYMIFVDSLQTGKPENPEAILRVVKSLAPNILLQLNAFQANHFIRFEPLGIYQQNGTFVLCPTSGKNYYARAVIVSRNGRLRLSVDSNGDGVHEDSQGHPLTCPRQ